METTADIPSIKRLERPASGRVLAGVCAGLGRYFDLSPTFYRLGFVVLTLLGGAGILVYLAAVAAISIAFAVFDISLSDGAGDRVYQPATTTALQPSYHLGVGKLHLDLTKVGSVTKETVVHAKVGVGEILVTVPQGLNVAVN